MGCTLKERLALILLDLTQNFGVRDHDGGVILNVPVRHGDLAELIGVSRPRVTEHLREFTQKQLISRENQHFVVNDKGLRDFLMETRREGLHGERP
jgi:CRP-like cAMP-binding protein